MNAILAADDLHDVLEAINSETMLGLVREVTGIRTIVKADAQATLYAPGHFLTRHNDAADEKLNRRIAYRVRELRAQRSLSLDALATKSGVSRSMLSLFPTRRTRSFRNRRTRSTRVPTDLGAARHHGHHLGRRASPITRR